MKHALASLLRLLPDLCLWSRNLSRRLNASRFLLYPDSPPMILLLSLKAIQWNLNSIPVMNLLAKFSANHHSYNGADLIL